MSIDHDQIIKTLVEAFFREFMLLFCAAEAALIDFSRVEFLRKEYFTDVHRGKRRSMDLVAKVRLKTGGEKFILIHVEFQSKRPGPNFARRIYRYMCQLFLRYDCEIVPIVVFTDDRVWKTPVPHYFEMEVAGTTFVRFEYHQVKLKSLNCRDFLGSKNPLAYALMAKMDYNRRDRIRMQADFLRLILGCPVDAARQSLLIEFVETYVPLLGEELESFERLIQDDEQYKELEQMVTVYEQNGLKKGMKKGIEKGKQDALIKQLGKKFGGLSKKMETEIRKIDSPERLDQLLLSVLDAKSLDGFLG